MQIKIHRGTHQIGGSITEIKTAQARIIIDIGSELPSSNKKENAVFDIKGVTNGIEKVLPKISIYIGKTAKQIFLTLANTLKKKLDKGNPELVKNFKEYEVGKAIIFQRHKSYAICG